MRIGSLFSGIGGLELGLEWSGLGETIWQVERDAFCREVLAKHWHTAERFDDVCSVGKHNLQPVDLICGGFPCQDVSSAGKGAGLAGKRSGLWREYARIVSELRPRWVVVENVASGAQRWLDTVVRELEDISYACFPVPLSAFDVGAPHLRRRIFIIAADAEREQLREQPRRGEWANGAGEAIATSDGKARVASEAHAHGEHAGAIHAEVAGASATLAHLDGLAPGGSSGPNGAQDWRPPVPEFLRVDDGVSSRMDPPHRRNQALGNSVVPACAEVVGWIVREIEEGR